MEDLKVDMVAEYLKGKQQIKDLNKEVTNNEKTNEDGIK